MGKKLLSGTVVSTKMERTVVVDVQTVRIHKIYKKRYRVNKKYKAHYNLKDKLVVGDKVTIVECNPISRTKKWIVSEVKQ